MSLLCQKCEKKNWGGGGLPTSFWREHAQKNTLNLKKSGVVSGGRPVFVSPKILQLDLWNEMFSIKYCLSGFVKEI